MIIVGWIGVFALLAAFLILARIVATQDERASGPCGEPTYLDDAFCVKPVGHIGFHETVDSLGHILWP